MAWRVLASAVSALAAAPEPRPLRARAESPHRLEAEEAAPWRALWYLPIVADAAAFVPPGFLGAMGKAALSAASAVEKEAQRQREAKARQNAGGR